MKPDAAPAALSDHTLPHIVRVDPDRPAGPGNPNWIIPPWGGAPLSLLLASRPAGTLGQGMHVHKVAQFHYILSGTMEFVVGGEQFPAPAGSLIWLPAGCPHDNKVPSDSGVLSLEFYVPSPGEGPRAFPAGTETDFINPDCSRPPAAPLFGKGVRWLRYKLPDNAVEIAGVMLDAGATLALQPTRADTYLYLTSGYCEVVIGNRTIAAEQHHMVSVSPMAPATLTGLGGAACELLLIQVAIGSESAESASP